MSKKLLGSPFSTQQSTIKLMPRYMQSQISTNFCQCSPSFDSSLLKMCTKAKSFGSFGRPFLLFYPFSLLPSLRDFLGSWPSCVGIETLVYHLKYWLPRSGINFTVRALCYNFQLQIDSPSFCSYFLPS